MAGSSPGHERRSGGRAAPQGAVAMLKMLPRAGGAAALVVATSLPASAVPQAAPRPELTAIQNVALDRGSAAERGTLVLRHGRIEGVLAASAPVPPGSRIVDGTDLVALPAFLDAYSRTGCATPEPVKDQDLPVDTTRDVRV